MKLLTESFLELVMGENICHHIFNFQNSSNLGEENQNFPSQVLVENKNFQISNISRKEHITR